MRSSRRPLVLAVAVLLVGRSTVAEARAGAVATEHGMAAAAGAEMLRAGGTAVDAALAAAAAVCVVHTASCGIGGGGFALVRRPDGSTFALDYRELAPAAMPPAPGQARLRTGGLAVGVPGEVAGLAALQRRLGTLPLARILAPAVRLARHGFALAEAPHLRREIVRSQALLAADPALRAVFLAPDGALPGEDFRVVQRDLATTLEDVGRRGPAAFYRGTRASRIVEAVRARGGVLTEGDLARYRPVWRRPLRATFQGRTILAFPPPASGGVVLEILGILGRDDVTALHDAPASAIHVLAQAMAQGFADRARWYGDPAYTNVPLDSLLAPARLATLRSAMSGIRTTAPAATAAKDGGTANVAAIDADGTAVALTTTINTGFGAGIGVAGTGIILNNEMDDFAAAPDVPNAFGLTGGEANSVVPGKRPQSSMSPTIVMAGERPILALGGSGGPTIISGVVQTVLAVVGRGADVRTAVAAPRIHDQAIPPVLAVEEGIPPTVRAQLERLGHRVTVVPMLGAVSAVGVDAAGTFSAAGDRRKDGGDAVVP